MSILVAGSVALDSVKTPLENHDRMLGGSASYAAVAASFFSPVKMVGIVGEDFPVDYLELFERRGVDLLGLQRAKGKTFAWSGEYEWDLNIRRTLSVELNVFEKFRPDLPEGYRETPYVLLGNIAPALQLHVLDQVPQPRFVVADTMDLWIQTAQEDLKALLKRVDMLILNDGEARELTKQTSLIKAGWQLQQMGPRYVAIKKGEHGCLLFGQGEFFSAPAYPLEDIHDPTGAGDCFAGGLLGFLATNDSFSFAELKRAVIFGSVLASFNVEAFSLGRLQTLTQSEIQERFKKFRELSEFGL
ncbi:MAG: sugar kinase [Verrucomicrobiae bacterium]|nr:sugar kinase [Verrucomicrobiae bacterium]